MPPPTEAAEGAKRRLSAIMVADIVGYSRLVGNDEIGALSAVRDIRERIVEPLLSQYDGRIVKLMGDGLLLEFGSAINAVKSAMEIQRGLAARSAATPVKSHIQFRIGIHVGDVVIDEQDILGDGVNIAARLEAIADPGGICLSAAVHDQVRDRLVCAFEDMGEQSLKNIARPLRVYRLLPDAEGSASRVEPVLAFTARPAIAVLPFDNLSGDPAETYFVDGLTDDIITSLSYWRWFPVIARNSTFSYKGKPKNATDIGRELNAAYLLEGSARRGGDRVRISAQLIDAATGRHLWAERFDRDMADVFALQEEIAERVVVAIEPELHRAEKQRALRTRSEHLGAWDFTLKALALQERMNRAGHIEARDLLAHALTLDQNFALAWSMLALCHYHEGILGWTADRAASLKASQEAAERAVELDELDWLAHALRGMGRLWNERDHDAALIGQQRAVALNPSAPLARHFLACVHEFSQRPAEAIPHIEALLRLDPRYRFASLALADQALCRFLLGELEQARVDAERAVRLQPTNVRARQRLIAVLTELGHTKAAQQAASELLALQPEFSRDYIEKTYPCQSAEERERFIGALRAAGLPLD
jgi:adenylate cyclase